MFSFDLGIIDLVVFILLSYYWKVSQGIDHHHHRHHHHDLALHVHVDGSSPLICCLPPHTYISTIYPQTDGFTSIYTCIYIYDAPSCQRQILILLTCLLFLLFPISCMHVTTSPSASVLLSTAGSDLTTLFRGGRSFHFMPNTPSFNHDSWVSTWSTDLSSSVPIAYIG